MAGLLLIILCIIVSLGTFTMLTLRLDIKKMISLGFLPDSFVNFFLFLFIVGEKLFDVKIGISFFQVRNTWLKVFLFKNGKGIRLLYQILNEYFGFCVNHLSLLIIVIVMDIIYRITLYQILITGSVEENRKGLKSIVFINLKETWSFLIKKSIFRADLRRSFKVK